MYQHLTECKRRAENIQISFCFCKTCICLKILENIQISVNMIDRLNITDEYSVKCDFILNTVIFIDAALNFLLRKFWKCNVLWFCLFGQWVPNETKGTINLKPWSCLQYYVHINDGHGKKVQRKPVCKLWVFSKNQGVRRDSSEVIMTRHHA